MATPSTPPPAVVPTAGARSGMRRRELVSLAVAVIVIAAGLAVLADPVYLHSGASSQPLSSALGLSFFRDELGYYDGAWDSYNDTLFVDSASSSLTTGDVGLSLQLVNGSAAPFPATAEVQVFDPDGVLVATFNLSEGDWSHGGLGTHWVPEDMLSVDWNQVTPTDPFRGEVLVATGTDGYQGTISVVLG